MRGFVVFSHAFILPSFVPLLSAAAALQRRRQKECRSTLLGEAASSLAQYSFDSFNVRKKSAQTIKSASSWVMLEIQANLIAPDIGVRR